MALESVRGYLQTAMGVGDATRERAIEVAQALIDLVSRVAPAELATVTSALADDLLDSARANREMIVELVRAEMSAVIESSSELVRLADLDAVRSLIGQLTDEIEGLRRQLADLAPGVSGSGAVAAVSTVTSALPGRLVGTGRPPEHEAPRRHLSTEPRVPRRTPSRPGPAARRRAAAAPAPAAPERGTPAPPSPESRSTVPPQGATTPAKKASTREASPKKATAKKATATKATGSRTVTSPPPETPTGTRATAKKRATKAATTSAPRSRARSGEGPTHS